MNAKRENGFSMLEALIATAIMALLLVGISGMYATNRSSHDRSVALVTVQQNARVAAENLVRELRHAGFDPSLAIPTLAEPTAIQVGDATSVTFVGDVTGDDVNDRVRYSLSGTQLMREFSTWTGSAFTTAQSSLLADGISALSIRYYDTANTELSAPLSSGDKAKVSRVTVGLSAFAPASSGVEVFPLNVEAFLRNM